MSLLRISPETKINKLLCEKDVSNTTPVHGIVNKKRNKIISAKLYDNMICANYTLIDGQINQEKIIQQSYSFTKKPIADT